MSSVPEIVMIESVGLELLRMMRHSGTVPGALAGADVPAALAHLKQGVIAHADRPLATDRGGDDEAGEREPRGSVAHRALLLIALLQRPIAGGDYVIWER